MPNLNTFLLTTITCVGICSSGFCGGLQALIFEAKPLMHWADPLYIIHRAEEKIRTFRRRWKTFWSYRYIYKKLKLCRRKTDGGKYSFFILQQGCLPSNGVFRFLFFFPSRATVLSCFDDWGTGALRKTLVQKKVDTVSGKKLGTPSMLCGRPWDQKLYTYPIFWKSF